MDFDYFIIIAAMRTGSNFLESTLDEFPEIECHGELFNPHFIGGPNRKNKFGLDQKAREADPTQLLNRMRQQSPGISGFRFFHDHDRRVLKTCLDDRRCAKIILTRNPVESYVSREIARQTDQWRLGDMKHAKSAQARFDAAEFEEYLARLQLFYSEVRHALQVSGQTAFNIRYEEISDSDVVNGIARFLGVKAARKKSTQVTKKQNPQPLSGKVVNFSEMQAALSSLDCFDLEKLPDFEPKRGAMVPNYIAPPKAPLLFMPIPAGPSEKVSGWMAGLDEVPASELKSGMTQKELRQWKRRAKGHRTFTVVRHPVARLHEAFVRHILLPGPSAYGEIRAALRQSYGLPVPETVDVAQFGEVEHREAFIAFAKFVAGNLAGQTSIRVDGAWASQAAIIQGMAQFMCPNYVLREDDLQADLDFLAQKVGRQAVAVPAFSSETTLELDRIYDEQVEAAVKAAYQRDYMMFGFGPWRT